MVHNDKRHVITIDFLIKRFSRAEGSGKYPKLYDGIKTIRSFHKKV
jgi:hypothetical protein